MTSDAPIVKSSFGGHKGGWLGLIVWIVGIAAVLVLVLAVAAVIIIDNAGAEAACNYITQKTGYAVSCDSGKVDALAGRVELVNLKIDNPKELGGGNFLTAPEFIFQADLLSLLSPTIHIRETMLHLSAVSDVKTSQGDNAQLFSQRLTGASPNTKNEAPATTPASNPPQKSSKVLIDHLKLQVDKVLLVDNTRGAAKTDSYDLNFSFERSNVTDVEGLKRELVTEFIRQGVANGGRNFIKMSKGLTSGLLNNGMGGVDDTLNGAIKGIKNIFK